MADLHHNQSTAYNRAFAVGVVLNALFVAVEAGYGLAAGSLALLADAGHNLSDVFSLMLAWGAFLLAGRSATARRTYGFRKATVIASLASALTLMVTLGGIAWEAIGRLLAPTPVGGPTIVAVALVGVVINTVTALMFASGQKYDLNIRGAFMHMAADAAVSLGVAAGGLVILYTGWLVVDPMISLVVVAVIFTGTWTLLKDSMNLALDAVPERIDMPAIKQYLDDLEPVLRYHDLHVWPLSTTEVALSVHLVVGDGETDANFLRSVQDELRRRFHIGHSTIQVEHLGDAPCLLDNGGCP